MFRLFLGYYQEETKYEWLMDLECVSSVETADGDKQNKGAS